MLAYQCDKNRSYSLICNLTSCSLNEDKKKKNKERKKQKKIKH